MQKTLSFIIILITLLVSCKPQKEEDDVVPSTIIAEEEFVQVLTDAYLCEGASGVNIKNVQGNQFDSTYAFNPLKDNRIEKAQFDSTIAYYSNHPKKMKLVYEKVLDKLSQILAAGKLDK